MADVQAKAGKTPELAGVFSNFNINVPQLYADLDRTKAEQLGVDVQDVFDTMQIYLGSLYVNDFNRFGRTYEVIAQADTPFRANAGRHSAAARRATPTGKMVPLGAVVDVTQTTGPDSAHALQRLPHAPISTARRRPAIRPARRRRRSRKILDETLPKGMQLRMDRSDLSADPRGQHGAAGLPDLRAAGLPGAGRAI